MGLIKYFFCINSRGSPVAVRAFLTEPSPSVVETFYNKVSEDLPPPPVFRADNLNFSYIVHANLYFVLVTEECMAPSVLLELLGRLVSVIADYAGQCSEKTMQDNLALVYEIVDEVMSFGCPQATDSSSLMHLVHNTVDYDPGLLKEIDVLDVLGVKQFDRPLAITAEQRRKANNEVFFIINEKVEMMLDTNNQAVRTLIIGTGTVKSFLQGQPSVLVQLDPQMTIASRGMKDFGLMYDDITFAPFVQTHSFDSDRSMTFVPPEGENVVFHYRCSRRANPPFTLIPVFENKQTKVVVVRLSIQATYAQTFEANDVVVRFQCPVEISSASCELPESVLSNQSGEYDSKTRQVSWRIKKFQGLQEFSARFRFMFDNGIPCAAESLLGPISMDFTLTGVLPSGLTVKNYLVSASGSGAAPKRWIKQIATAQCYTYNFI